MSPSPDRLALLHRMQEERRQILRQIDLIDRQITRRMTALIPQLTPSRRQLSAGQGAGPERNSSSGIARILRQSRRNASRRSTHCPASSRGRMPRPRRTVFATASLR